MAPEYEERERRSWSEIDKLKDRSGHRKPDRGENQQDRLRDKRAMSQYKAQLDKLFTPGKKNMDDEDTPKLKKLREISDRGEFIKAANKFLQDSSLPNQWEDLENFLRHDDPELLSETINRMEGLLSEQSQTAQENFQKDLHLIEMTTRDKVLRKQVSKLLRKIAEPQG
jgi:hypothetical protein